MERQLRKNNDDRLDFLAGVLPYGINPTDIDLVIERNKRFLVLEGQRDRKQSTAWFIDNASGNGQKDDVDADHGTQKPLLCMRRPIDNNSIPGDGVYDPFLRSGWRMAPASSRRACLTLRWDATKVVATHKSPSRSRRDLTTLPRSPARARPRSSAKPCVDLRAPPAEAHQEKTRQTNKCLTFAQPEKEI